MSNPVAHNRRPSRLNNASSALNTPSVGADAIRVSYAISATPRPSALGERYTELLNACHNNDLPLFLAHMRRSDHAAWPVHYRYSLLIGACSHDAHRIVQWLSRNNRTALERKDYRGNTPLHHAAAAGAVRCIAALRAAHVRLDMRNHEGATALHFAAYHGRRETAALLVAASRSLLDAHDKTGKTPLMLAAFRGRTQAASLLLARGASVNMQDRAGWSALMYAAFAGRIAICRELLEFAANPALKDRSSSRCAGDWARCAGYYEVADMLQNRTVDLRTPSLPEGVDMPYLHLPTSAFAYRSPISKAPSLLQPAIERALSPTRRRSRARPLPSPTISQPAVSPIVRCSINEMPHFAHPPKGLNIAMAGCTPKPSLKQPTTPKKVSPVLSTPASPQKQQSQKLSLSTKQRSVEPTDSAPSEKKKSPNAVHARSAPPPPQQKLRKLAAKQPRATADPKAPRRIQQKTGRLVRIKRNIAPVSEALPPPLPLKSNPQKVVSPQKTPQPQKHTPSRKPVPPHALIAVVNEARNRAAGVQKTLSLSSRIRDTVSRASLRYLDSRTPPDLRSSASSSRDLEAAQATGRQQRRLPTLASPRRHSHNSAWMGPCWRAFACIVTLWMPSIVLRKFLHKETPGKRQAWREKLALCLIILLITAVTALISFGLSAMLCHPVEPVSPETLLSDHGANSTQPLVAVRGRIYDLSDPVANAPLHLSDADYGRDVAMLLPPFPEEAAACRHWAKGSLAHICTTYRTQNPRCIPSAKAWNTLRRYSTQKWVVHTWRNVLRPDNPDGLFAYNGFVYSLKSYFSDGDTNYGAEADSLLPLLAGSDATIAVSRSRTLQALVPCWNAQLRVGRIEGSTPGCIITSGITIAATVVLNAMILIKLLCAVLFDWAFSLQLRKITKHFTRSAVPGRRVPHVIVAVTCCNETEATLRSTLDAIALSNYACSRKLLFIVADGDVATAADIGVETNVSPTTSRLLRAMIRPSGIAAPRALPYMSVGEGPREFNAAEVVPGTYTSTNGIVVPCILVIKVGTALERSQALPKSGNRGKRDSQLILLQWLRSVLMNDRLTPLEFELCRAAEHLAGTRPDRFEYLLMIDADTAVDIECIPRLVAAMERDPGIMGLCGETRIANKRDSWVTRIQVYEYYISHHLSKAFESLWGGVTCLPGCCSMYRVFATKQGSNTIVPLLVAPEVIRAYSSNDTHTLHQKNLLLLGEDRYLTTVLLRVFPKRKLIYVPRAICRTNVPGRFSELLSQRRRWINSTIHNLLELLLVRDLCGTFCCSMHFLVLMDLLGNVILPSSAIFCYYLIVARCFGEPVALPLLLMALTFVLQGAMILVTTQRIGYIYWMLIYILAIPVWNLVMPLYAFWRFDDFSWGRARPNDPTLTNSAFITDDERLALEPIPLKRWRDWIRENPSGFPPQPP